MASLDSSTFHETRSLHMSIKELRQGPQWKCPCRHSEKWLLKQIVSHGPPFSHHWESSWNRLKNLHVTFTWKSIIYPSSYWFLSAPPRIYIRPRGGFQKNLRHQLTGMDPQDGLNVFPGLFPYVETGMDGWMDGEGNEISTNSKLSGRRIRLCWKIARGQDLFSCEDSSTSLRLKKCNMSRHNMCSIRYLSNNEDLLATTTTSCDKHNIKR